MKKSELPPEIREMTAAWLYSQSHTGRWNELSESVKTAWCIEASKLLSKLTKHGVVMLAEDQIFNCEYDKDGNLRGLYDWYKVVNLDGTVKEG